jgi:hypothetical protein
LRYAPPAMALDLRTIGELEKDGFTHIDACCASCGRIVQMPFKLLLTRERITTATIIAKLRSACSAASRRGPQQRFPLKRLFTFGPRYSVSKSFVLRAGEGRDINASTVDQA